MGLVETEGLVLKSYGLSEADKIVVFLTREHGLVRGVAKGAKRMKSRFGSGLEPFSVVRLTYFQKEERELVSVGQVDLIDSFFDSAADPLVFQKFSYFAELLTEFAPPADPNERLYRMAIVCLESIRATPLQIPALTLYFELWLLRLSGYLPSWDRCVICGRDIAPAEDAVLEATFQTSCRECRGMRGRRMVSTGERAMLAAGQKLAPARFAESTEGHADEVRDLSDILKNVIAVVLGRESVGERILITVN